MTNAINYVVAEKAPLPRGHYSQAVVHGGVIYVSVQLPIIPPDKITELSIEEQAVQLFNNVISIVDAGGGTKETILKVTIYISDISGWTKVNEIFEKTFVNHKPARGVIEVPKIHLGYKIAMDAVAAVTLREN